MIYFHKNAWKTESYRKFLDEGYYHHHHHYRHPLVLLPLQYHMNFEKLIIIAKGHFLCVIFLFLYRRTSLPNAHTHSTTTVYRLILLLAFAIEIGNNEVSYLSPFQRRYAGENILSPFLLSFPRITQIYQWWTLVWKIQTIVPLLFMIPFL